MTTIHFIRHGNVDNPENVYYGRLPGFPLSEEGRQCIAYAARQLASQGIGAIYASPLLRTRQSAEILSQQLGCPITIDERLIELATLFEGKPRGQQTSGVPYHSPVKSDFSETMEEIYQRMANFVHDKALAHPDQQIVAVSHGSPIRILQMGLQGLPFTDMIYAEEEIPICGADMIVTVAGQQIRVVRTDLE